MFQWLEQVAFSLVGFTNQSEDFLCLVQSNANTQKGVLYSPNEKVNITCINSLIASLEFSLELSNCLNDVYTG